MVKLNENAVREAAYYNWQNAGCPQGQDEYFWALAIEQLSSCCKSSSCKSSSAKKTSTSTKKASCKTASKKSK